MPRILKFPPVPLALYGEALRRPCAGVTLVADGSDARFGSTPLQFSPVIGPSEHGIDGNELVRRLRTVPEYAGLNWGQRALELAWRYREDIARANVWPVGRVVYFLRTIWATRKGEQFGFWMMRYKDGYGWSRGEFWLDYSVGSMDLFPRLTPVG